MINTSGNRIFFVLILFIFSVAVCMAQTGGKMGTIAIFPFNGSSRDERDGIAELFSFTSQMMDNFVVIPRTAITSAIDKEQDFQLSSGMTDSDTMVRIGNQFGADYVMSGSITALGDSKLLIVSIVKIDVIQQVTGDYLIYNSLDDLYKDSSIITKMAENLLAMMNKAAGNTDKLAVLPVQFSGGTNEQEGDALAQLLSIHLIRNGKYEVYPRTQNLEQVQQEYETQMSGQTRDSEMVSLGHGINPEYVLSIISRRIGNGNLFNAVVIDLEGGNQIAGNSQRYASLSDGINAMELLSKELSGIKVTDRERARRAAVVENTVEAEQKAVVQTGDARKREAALDTFLKRSGIEFYGWLGVPLGTGNSGTGDGKEGNNTEVLGGAKIGLRLYSFFQLESGVGVVQKYAAHNERIIALQIPAVAKINLWLLSYIRISPYAGIGMNVRSASKSFSPYSLIVGGDVGLQWERVTASMGIEYNHEFDDPRSTNTAILCFTLKYFFPFRKE